jgi:hypothetical protein
MRKGRLAGAARIVQPYAQPHEYIDCPYVSALGRYHERGVTNCIGLDRTCTGKSELPQYADRRPAANSPREAVFAVCIQSRRACPKR